MNQPGILKQISSPLQKKLQKKQAQPAEQSTEQLIDHLEKQIRANNIPAQTSPQLKQPTFAKCSPEFSDYWKKSGRKVHGGVYSLNKRKTARPLNCKKPLHLVLRSSKAKGALSFLNPQNRKKVDQTVRKYADKLQIKIYQYSNNGNHLHLVVKVHSRKQFQKYLRTITGLIARLILKAKKGSAKGKFWDALAFTRIADWGRAYQHLKKYVIQNILEAAGVIPYTPRNHQQYKKYKLVTANSS